MLLKITAVIPFWKPYSAYPRDAHFMALRKFGALWVISILPLLTAAGLKPLSDSHPYSWYSFLLSLKDVFSDNHQFIYAVAFIPPTIYLLVERYLSYSQHIDSGKRSTKELHVAPPGFMWLIFCSVVVFLFTLVSFSTATANKGRDDITFLDQFSRQSAVFVYVFAMLCWYFTILESISPPEKNYIEAQRKQEKNLQIEFNKRKESNV